MFILRKKQLAMILCALFVSFSFYLAAENTAKKSFDIKQVSALPIDSKVIVIDAGHGRRRWSVLLVPVGIDEAELNLKIALKLQNLLEQSGTTVILTRSDDTSIYELDKKTLSQKKVSDIKNRVKIGNESGADIFVSIHMNKIPQTQYDGWQTFYNVKSEEGKFLAESIQDALNDTIARKNTRLAKSISNIYIVDHVEIPLTIVECGFLSNQEELSLLVQDDYQDSLAFGIYTGIINYFKNLGQ